MTRRPTREEERTREAPRTIARVCAAMLEVTAGPDLGAKVRVDRPTFVVGTADAADLLLTDATVSREHLRLALLADGVHARDAGSKNGTWIGGARIADAVITEDTTLELGTTSLTIRLESTSLDLPVTAEARFGAALGASVAMRHLFAVLRRAAASDVTILIEGESGVGKEVLAHAVHDASPRATGPFVAVDCGAIPAGLIESELFGHERGAFTGATAARAGAFEQANGGTLFLDEIGELPIDMQPKLLRALEQREVRVLGSQGPPRAVDVRVVAATNRRLDDAMKTGLFRPDLFYRLAVVRAVVPPLRDRPEDIAPLATACLRTVLRDDSAELPADLRALLGSYAWPGNVRELRNVIERYVVLGARDASGLFGATQSGATLLGLGDELWQQPYHEARRRVLERFEREYIPRAVERAGGVIARAAEMAQVARPSFYRMLERVRLGGGGDDGEP